jgi:hypothetical protein
MSFINDFLMLFNWEIISGVVSIIEVIISSLLTFIIIKQTYKLNKMQNAMEEKLNYQQSLLQKRQIKIDTFPYKRELYLNLFKVLEFSNFLTETLFKLDISNKSAADIYQIYKVAEENYLGDSIEIVGSLRESEYILPLNISSTVVVINKTFDNICARFMVLGTLSKALTNEELQKTKTLNIDSIKEGCLLINSRVPFLQSIMAKELDISTLDR